MMSYANTKFHQKHEKITGNDNQPGRRILRNAKLREKQGQVLRSYGDIA